MRSKSVFQQQVLADDGDEVLASRALLTKLMGNRELLLAAVLAGPKAWRENCIKLFWGLRFTDDMIASLWNYIFVRRGPNPAYEYERLQEAREARENQERSELAALQELYALSHGKNREEEEAKRIQASPAPEMARLPEIKQV